ncbi:glycosyltransferase family 2 protein [Candidatus Roizmanbacteria bacterium]|nr:glycosyltransferase family 2 protein [Candidatus Roizmanbacteria bacterium]
MKRPCFSILIPSYNGEDTIGDALNSILAQDFTDYEIIISDDSSTDQTVKVLRSFKDKRIRLYTAKKNIGYPGNLNRCMKKARGKYIYLLGQDDLLGGAALQKTYDAFQLRNDIGAVTRPYRWFDDNLDVTVRVKKGLNSNKDEIISINDPLDQVIKVFTTLDSLSGLAYKADYIDRPFHPDIFPCHVYPFAAIFKKYPIVFLKDYVIAVRIASSQCRYLSSIYDKSPLQSWVDMFNTIFKEKKFLRLRKYCIQNFVAVNYVGLVQIKNYGRYRYVLREIMLLLKYRPQNFFNLIFWFFSVGTLIAPPAILIPLVDWYKQKINSLRFSDIRFDYNFQLKKHS